MAIAGWWPSTAAGRVTERRIEQRRPPRRAPEPNCIEPATSNGGGLACYQSRPPGNRPETPLPPQIPPLRLPTAPNQGNLPDLMLKRVARDCAAIRWPPLWALIFVGCNSDPGGADLSMVTGLSPGDAACEIDKAAPSRLPAILTPPDLTSSLAYLAGPFDGHTLDIHDATDGGRLVVTSAFSLSFAIADTGSPYDPVGGTGGFNHLYVDSPPGDLVPGRALTRVSGVLNRLNGFPELFACAALPSDTLAPLPATQEISGVDLKVPTKLLRLAAATVIVSGKVCSPGVNDDSWVKYNEFYIDSGGGCGAFDALAVALPTKHFGAFDPLQSAGHAATITGMLSYVAGQNDACTGRPVACQTRADCSTAGEDSQYDAACQRTLKSAACSGGFCKRGFYAFWTVNPRAPADVQVE